MRGVELPLLEVARIPYSNHAFFAATAACAQFSHVSLGHLAGSVWRTGRQVGGYSSFVQSSMRVNYLFLIHGFLCPLCGQYRDHAAKPGSRRRRRWAYHLDSDLLLSICPNYLIVRDEYFQKTTVCAGCCLLLKRGFRKVKPAKDGDDDLEVSAALSELLQSSAFLRRARQRAKIPYRFPIGRPYQPSWMRVATEGAA